MGIALILLKGLLQMDSRTPLTVTKQRVLYAEAAKKPQQKLSFFEDFMMGGASASVSKTISAPIERVKMMVQNQGEMLKQGLIDTPYAGVVDCFKRLDVLCVLARLRPYQAGQRHQEHQGRWRAPVQGSH